MATRQDFTDEEWAALQKGLTGSGMLVSVSDRDFTDTFGEAGALAKFLSGQQVAATNDLVRELAKTRGTGFGLTDSPDKVRSETMAALALEEGGEEFAKLALRRIDVLCGQKALDPALYETYYWDSSAQYFSPWVGRSSEPGELQASGSKLAEALENLEVDTREVVTAPTDFRVLDSQIAVVECAQMIVRDGGIAFGLS